MIQINLLPSRAAKHGYPCAKGNKYIFRVFSSLKDHEIRTSQNHMTKWNLVAVLLLLPQRCTVYPF